MFTVEQSKSRAVMAQDPPDSGHYVLGGFCHPFFWRKAMSWKDECEKVVMEYRKHPEHFEDDIFTDEKTGKKIFATTDVRDFFDCSTCFYCGRDCAKEHIRCVSEYRTDGQTVQFKEVK